MTFLLTLAFVAALGVLLWQRLRSLLTYFQQEEYDNPRFLASLWSVRLFDLRASLAVIIGLGLVALGVPETLVLAALALAFLTIAQVERRYRYKKPLAMTERARRIYRLALAFALVVALGATVWMAWALVALQFAPLALVLANALLAPMQERINDGYVAQARAKLARLDPVRIGITGSFGKTTVKHMLAEILEASGPVFYSRGSINTVLGHTRHLRERLQWSHRYFVAEMGAYGIGSIQRLCDFVKPGYGIITAIGDAHTERFGSIDAIAQAKSELALNVCAAGGTVVLNHEVLAYAPFKALKARFGDQIVSVGPVGADVTITASEVAGGAWSITLHSTVRPGVNVVYDLPVLGAHNVMNSALAVTLALILDDRILGQVPYFTKTLAQIPHRLQKLETPGAALILDDAYNSNEQGFMSAVTSLDSLARQRGGRRILVTPGIAELGLEHDRVHARLGAFCADKCDRIYVVNPNRIRAFVAAIPAGTAEVIEVGSLIDARKALARDPRAEDVILYENDLPDLLEEKRLL